MTPDNRLARLAPGLFVLLWATGFIGAKYGLPFAPPLTFLGLRFAIVAAILALVALATGAPWPKTRRSALHSAVAGMLIHGVYLGGVFWAISLGMPAGISALIVGTQPLLSAVLSGPLLGERIRARHWTGLGVGFAGLLLVLGPMLGTSSLSALTPVNVALCIGALLGITFGTIYQKAFSTAADLRTGGVVQYAAALVLIVPAALWFETNQINWTPEFIGALGWLVIVLSLGAISLLMFIIRHGEVSKVATLFYLVPPVTALMAWGLFGESLGPVQLGGMGLIAFSIWLAGSR
ncbi:MAG: EamA family transporter [Hyphomicrobiales bacterium]|nr:MAG: EamA family transporter [Hyphomicrobiales bacterium]